MKILKYFRNMEDKLGFVVYLIMLVISFCNVIARYVFHASWSFTEEFTTTALVLLSLLGAATAAREGSHFNMSYIADMIPGRAYEIIQGINNLIAGITSLVLTVTSMSMVLYQYEMHTISVTMHIPEWIYGSFMPIGCAFMTYRFLGRSIRFFFGKLHKEGDGTECL